MKKKGFTLTEVLITLGIIGVIAALTIPQLYNNTSNAHLGAQLANAVSTLENGIGLYLYDEGVRNLAQLGADDVTAGELLNRLSTGSNTTTGKKYIKLVQYTSSLPPGVTCAQNTVYSLPDKSIICAASDAKISSFNGSEGATLLILSASSLNQQKALEGLDWFTVTIANDGFIYLPGRDYDTNAACDQLTGGPGCVGKIAANGWKFDGKIFDAAASTGNTSK